MKFRGITIHKNKNCDTWYTRIRKNGKQLYISAKTQKECYDLLKKQYKSTTQTIKEEKEENKVTLREWYEKWLKLYKSDVKDATIRTYKVALQHIPIQIQNKKIDKIKLEELIQTLNDCQAKRVRQNLYDLLNMLFKKAKDNDIIDKNILEKIEKPKHEKEHGKALTNEEQKKLIETCKVIKDSDFILISMYQGLRRGEVLGLTRNNIDFENSTLTIDKAWNYKNQFDTTKNAHSKRTMPLFDTSKEILLKYKNKKNHERIFEISMKQHDLIMKKIKKICPIKDIRTKDMRSTFITRCDELGINETVIQSWVGHRIGSKVTKQVYTKHNNEIDVKYIEILNNSKFYSNSTQMKK